MAKLADIYPNLAREQQAEAGTTYELAEPEATNPLFTELSKQFASVQKVYLPFVRQANLWIAAIVLVLIYLGYREQK